VIDLDGKILPDISWIEDMNRLPVLVSGGGKDELLGILKLTSGTGCNESKAVYDLLEAWKLTKKSSDELWHYFCEDF